MKILQVIPVLGIGGAEIMCENLTYELIKKGHDVVVVSLYSSHSLITERLENKGVKIYYLSKKKGMDLSVIPRIRKVIKAERPEVVHTHLDALKYVGVATYFKKIRIVHTIHSLAEKNASRATRRIYKNFFKRGVVPVALSKVVQQSIENTYKLNAYHIPIVFNGIDLSKCISKQEYSLKDTFTIVHIGRFADVKNHIGLLKAFKIFYRKYPNTVLQLIGDGEKKGEAEQFVTDNGLCNVVEFLGVQDNVYKYLNEADIFTLPSLYEGVPLTLIEAMGTGLPIVATNVGGIPDMLENKKYALLVDVDEEKIAEAFLELAKDAEKRSYFGKKAKESSIKFSASIMAEKYLEIYVQDRN